MSVVNPRPAETINTVGSVDRRSGEHRCKKQALARLVATLGEAAQRRANQSGERTDVQPLIPDGVFSSNSTGDSSPSDNGIGNGISLEEVADSQASTNNLQPGKANMPPEQYRQAIKGDLEAQEALAQAGLINQGNIGQLYDDVMSYCQRHQGKGLVSLRICPEAKVTKYWRAVASDQVFDLNQRADEEETDKVNNGADNATSNSDSTDDAAHGTDDISSIDLDVVASQLHELGVISRHDELSELLTAGLPNDTFRLTVDEIRVPDDTYDNILGQTVGCIPGMPEIVERLTPRQLSYCRFYKTYHEEFPELNWMRLWEFGERGPTGKYWLEALAGGDEELYGAYLRDHSDDPANPINIIEALRLAGQLDDPDAISVIERVIDTPDIPPESLRRLGATLTQLQDKFPLITDPDSYAQLLQLCLKGGDQALGDDYLGHVAFYNTYAIDNLLEMDPDQLHNVRRHLDMLTGLDLMPYDRARLTNLPTFQPKS